MQHMRVNVTKSVHQFLGLEVGINDTRTCSAERFGISDVEFLKSIT
jgi:hypothetical protein